MFKKVFLATAVLLCSVLPVQAHQTSANQEVKVYKFNTVGDKVKLERTYFRKWGALTLDKKNVILIDLLSTDMESIAGYSLYINEIVLLDGNLRLVNLISRDHLLEFQIAMASRKICAKNPSTQEYTICRSIDQI